MTSLASLGIAGILSVFKLGPKSEADKEKEIYVYLY